MIKLTIDKISNGYRITLFPPTTSFFPKLILGVLTFGCIVYPLKVLFTTTHFAGDYVVACLSLIMAYLTGRLWLWNTFGREVFEISGIEVVHYNNYQFFKDVLIRVSPPTPIHFSYKFILKKHDADLLDSEGTKLDDKCYLTINSGEKELSKAHLPLTEKQIEEVFAVLPGDFH